MKMVPEQIGSWIKGRYTVLGTDGFGLSDSREALRRHFEVDAPSIVIAALHSLHQDGRLPASVVAAAIRDLDYDPEKLDPTTL